MNIRNSLFNQIILTTQLKRELTLRQSILFSQMELLNIPNNLGVIQDLSSDHLPVQLELDFGPWDNGNRSPILRNDLNLLTKLIKLNIKNHNNHV